MKPSTPGYPTYLHDHLGYSQGRAAGLSAVFPWAGAFSALAAGWLSDRLGLTGRSLLLLLGLLATAAALLVLMAVPGGVPGALLPLATIAVVAFCLLGPYSYLGGAFALDFGGKQASAASSGIIDGIGYAGGALAGDRRGAVLCRVRVASCLWRTGPRVRAGRGVRGAAASAQHPRGENNS